MEMDLMNIDPAQESHMHKLKKLVQTPNSYFMDVKCPGCYRITTVSYHNKPCVLKPTVLVSFIPLYCSKIGCIHVYNYDCFVFSQNNFKALYAIINFSNVLIDQD